MTRDIYWPMIAMVALTIAVWVVMYRRRVAEMRSRRIHPQSVSTQSQMAVKLENVTAADNFRNLFEVPLLFYLLCLCLAQTGTVTTLQLRLAWAYVALRALHSAIQITYNRVMHRFWAYLLSCLVLFTMWGLFGLSLLRPDL